MPELFVPVKSVKQYFRDYIVKGIQNGVSREMIKQQLLDSFQKEIFGQLTLKFKDAAILARPADQMPEEERAGVQNILHNSMRKWQKLCYVAAGYPQTRMIIEQRDLQHILDDIVEAQAHPEVLEMEDGTVEVVKGDI